MPSMVSWQPWFEILYPALGPSLLAAHANRHRAISCQLQIRSNGAGSSFLAVEGIPLGRNLDESCSDLDLLAGRIEPVVPDGQLRYCIYADSIHEIDHV